jgi:hypothetical protein
MFRPEHVQKGMTRQTYLAVQSFESTDPVLDRNLGVEGKLLSLFSDLGNVQRSVCGTAAVATTGVRHHRGGRLPTAQKVVPPREAGMESREVRARDS